MIEAKIAAIADGLAKAMKRDIVRTPHPQPLEGHWFWPGSTSDAVYAVRLGLLDRSGFTPLGLAVKAYLEAKDSTV